MSLCSKFTVPIYNKNKKFILEFISSRESKILLNIKGIILIHPHRYSVLILLITIPQIILTKTDSYWALHYMNLIKTVTNTQKLTFFIIIETKTLILLEVLSKRIDIFYNIKEHKTNHLLHPVVSTIRILIYKLIKYKATILSGLATFYTSNTKASFDLVHKLRYF